MSFRVVFSPEAIEQLVILGLFYGGQNYEFLLRGDAEGLPM